MYLTDFIYDGVKLSSLGYLVGSAVTSNNESASAGSKLELTTFMNRGNHINHIIDTTYNETITATFDIIKYACEDTTNNIVEGNEISYIMKWLNRTQYYDFFPLYNDLSLPNVFFKGTFTDIQTIQMGGNVVGFTVTFTASTPYGFSNNENIEYNYVNTFTYYDESDEYGNHYPEQMIISIQESGDLELFNSLNNRLTVINNCTSGENITLDCIHKMIETDAFWHNTLYKDFNYVYPAFCTKKDDIRNVFNSNLTCSFDITYKPIRKVGIVV